MSLSGDAARLRGQCISVVFPVRGIAGSDLLMVCSLSVS